ncbi:hypothetical protein TIFTF001_000074 [Ficus carica]|uniref:DUF7731 domain-containing protein n=1 Tax=Ficus carica TaxID=3494 RepID=A0AA87Z377_FICCA|nr:hypothetical protein TIFTF001_000074 [Ficus carica]
MGILTPKGNLSVSQQNLVQYCAPGNCSDQIRFTVLNCILLVHDKFVFANNATIQYVNDTITTRCAKQDQDLIIASGPPKNSGIKVNQKTYVSVVSALLVFLAIFNM